MWQWLTNTTGTSGEQRSRAWLERGLTPCWLQISGLSPHFPSQVLVSSPEFYLTCRGILIWQNRYDAWYFLLVQHASVHAYLSAGMLGDNCEFLLFDVHGVWASRICVRMNQKGFLTLSPQSPHSGRGEISGESEPILSTSLFVCRDLVSVESSLQARKGLAVLNGQKGQ